MGNPQKVFLFCWCEISKLTPLGLRAQIISGPKGVQHVSCWMVVFQASAFQDEYLSGSKLIYPPSSCVALLMLRAKMWIEVYRFPILSSFSMTFTPNLRLILTSAFSVYRDSSVKMPKCINLPLKNFDAQ